MDRVRNASDNSGKPSWRREPRAYLRRQLRLKLNDLVGRWGLRVSDYVPMTSIRSTRAFHHIIDVGVAEGTADLYARCPDAVIELFEPSPRFFPELEAGIMRTRTCRLHKMAVGAENGEATFHLTGPASSTLQTLHDKSGRAFPSITVLVRRLDEVLCAAELKRPAVLKIDTEGFELEVLRGAEKLLPAIDSVIIEVHMGKTNAYRPQQILDIMARHGFALIDVLNSEVRNGQVTCVDIVFERPAPTA